MLHQTMPHVFQPVENNVSVSGKKNPMKTYGSSLLELAEHRQKTDSTWLPGSSDQEAGQKLLDEIHALITSELVRDCVNFFLTER